MQIGYSLERRLVSCSEKVFGKGGIKVEPASRLTTVGHGQEM